jgi:hypothetical protein
MDDLHDSDTDIDREVLTYELFGTAARELAGQVADSGSDPTSCWPSPAAGSPWPALGCAWP